MDAVIQFLAVIAVCIGGLMFAVNMFPKSKDDKFPDGMAWFCVTGLMEIPQRMGMDEAATLPFDEWGLQ